MVYLRRSLEMIAEWPPCLPKKQHGSSNVCSADISAVVVFHHLRPSAKLLLFGRIIISAEYLYIDTGNHESAASNRVQLDPQSPPSGPMRKFQKLELPLNIS